MGLCSTKFESHEIPSSIPLIGKVLQKPYDDIAQFYDIGEVLRQGKFTTTYIVTEKSTRQQYACKSISRRKLVNDKDIEYVRREIGILQHLSGQPNIVEFKGVYEDKNNVHLVTELCRGKELFNIIDNHKGKGSVYSEKEAAKIARQIVNVVHCCHFLGVIHRDLRLENFLFVDEKSPLIKATGFGHSVFIEEVARSGFPCGVDVLSEYQVNLDGDRSRKVYRNIVGSAYYVAPEVLRRNYGKEVDVWSVGVILYILLSGVPPFWADKEEGIFEEIIKSRLDLESDPWPSITNGAKDLIRKMLTVNPKKRITAAEALEDPWLQECGEASVEPLDNVVLIRMKQFRAMNKLKNLALKVIAENLSKEEIKGLKQMFNNMDTDRSGMITYEKLKNGLSKLGSKLSEKEIKALMKAVDVDNNGTIDYIEFIAATMHRHNLDKEDNLNKAFKLFDKDNKGYITRDDLKQAMSKYGMGDDQATIDEFIKDVDLDNNGNINHDEFVTMMRKETTENREQQNGTSVIPQS